MHEQEIPLFELYNLWYIPFYHQAWFVIVLSGFVLLLSILIFWFIYRWYKKRPKKKLVYWQEILISIEQLSPHTFIREQRSDLFYAEITLLLKKYLEQRYSVILMDKTDHELMKILFVNNYCSQKELKNFESIITGAVFIKFAHQQAVFEKMQHDKYAAINFVKKTLPESHKAS